MAFEKRKMTVALLSIFSNTTRDKSLGKNLLGAAGPSGAGSGNFTPWDVWSRGFF